MLQRISEVYFHLNKSDALLGFLPCVPKGCFNLTLLLLFMLINMAPTVHSPPHMLLSYVWVQLTVAAIVIERDQGGFAH